MCFSFIFDILSFPFSFSSIQTFPYVPPCSFKFLTSFFINCCYVYETLKKLNSINSTSVFGWEASFHSVPSPPPNPFSIFLVFFISCWTTCYLSFISEIIFVSLDLPPYFSSIAFWYFWYSYIFTVSFQIYILHLFISLLIFNLKSLLMLHFFIVWWFFLKLAC